MVLASEPVGGISRVTELPCFQMVTLNFTFDDLLRLKWPKVPRTVDNCTKCYFCSFLQVTCGIESHFGILWTFLDLLKKFNIMIYYILKACFMVCMV